MRPPSRTQTRTTRRAPRRRRARRQGPEARGARRPSAKEGARARRREGGALQAEPGSALQLGPGLLPLRVVHAVLLAVAAVGDRRLPEVDLLEVLERRVRVVLRARALGELLHPRARLRVDRRLAEVDGLLGLHLRSRDVRQPLVGAVE